MSLWRYICYEVICTVHSFLFYVMLSIKSVNNEMKADTVTWKNIYGFMDNLPYICYYVPIKWITNNSIEYEF